MPLNIFSHTSHNIRKLFCYFLKSSRKELDFFSVFANDHSKAVVFMLNSRRLAANAKRFFQISNFHRQHNINWSPRLELHVLKCARAFLRKLKREREIIGQVIHLFKLLPQTRLVVEKCKRNRIQHQSISHTHAQVIQHSPNQIARFISTRTRKQSNNNFKFFINRPFPVNIYNLLQLRKNLVHSQFSMKKRVLLLLSDKFSSHIPQVPYLIEHLCNFFSSKPRRFSNSLDSQLR